ncbi:hypothetical protein JB92DRAFT_734840 [Gautieria morchelliformis]|nr:hypothetical protein JB92DRAFT_734840 [Gautieria morchelliformis]
MLLLDAYALGLPFLFPYFDILVMLLTKFIPSLLTFLKDPLTFCLVLTELFISASFGFRRLLITKLLSVMVAYSPLVLCIVECFRKTIKIRNENLRRGEPGSRTASASVTNQNNEPGWTMITGTPAARASQPVGDNDWL